MTRVSVVFVILSVLFQAAWISAKHIKHSKKNVGVYGGDFIGIEQAPWMALVYTSEAIPCSGTIVDSQYVLTIDTCCKDHGKPRNNWHVRVATDGRTSAGYVVNIQDAYPFKEPGTDYNLKPVPCLLKLKTHLGFGRTIQPAVLDEPDVILENGTQVTFVAYGRPAPLDKTYGLRRTTLPISDADWCKDENKRLGGGQICAGDHDHNACGGDAGGALTTGRYLVGVLSEATSDCRSNPSRFCRISHYRPWINNIINPKKP